MSDSRLDLIGPGACNPSHPDEALPRAETWLKERANWEDEVRRQRDCIRDLEARNAELQLHCKNLREGEDTAYLNACARAEAAEARAKGLREAAIAHLQYGMVCDCRHGEDAWSLEDDEWCDWCRGAFALQNAIDALPRELEGGEGG